MEYLTKEQILLIHSIIVSETGGLHGVREHGAILSLEALPQQKVFGKELYPTIFLKAAVYVRNIIFSHPFLDGNKRTAMTSASVFLENNGYKIGAKEGEIEKIALRVISNKLSLEQMALWLKKNSKPIRRK